MTAVDVKKGKGRRSLRTQFSYNRPEVNQPLLPCVRGSRTSDNNQHIERTTL
jgi:hypothetical protein